MVLTVCCSIEFVPGAVGNDPNTHTSIYSKRHFFLSLARRDLYDSSHLISKPFKSVFLSKLSARSYLQVGETVKNF